MYIIICEIVHQSSFDAWDRVLRTGALGWPWGIGWVGRWEGGSGLGTHVHPWLIHVNIWQKPLQYCKVISLQFKKKVMIRRNANSHHSQQKNLNCSTWMQSPKWQNDLGSFPRQSIQYHSNLSLCPDQQCWRNWSWTVLWRPTKPSRTNTQKIYPFH